jgi:hypothetical protein
MATAEWTIASEPHINFLLAADSFIERSGSDPGPRVQMTESSWRALAVFKT